MTVSSCYHWFKMPYGQLVCTLATRPTTLGGLCWCTSVWTEIHFEAFPMSSIMYSLFSGLNKSCELAEINAVLAFHSGEYTVLGVFFQVGGDILLALAIET
eukprot:11039045-Ditylum_brightwellii.AAC.1